MIITQHRSEIDLIDMIDVLIKVKDRRGCYMQNKEKD